jgi:hypothetical protein
MFTPQTPAAPGWRWVFENGQHRLIPDPDHQPTPPDPIAIALAALLHHVGPDAIVLPPYRLADRDTIAHQVGTLLLITQDEWTVERRAELDDLLKLLRAMVRAVALVDTEVPS